MVINLGEIVNMLSALFPSIPQPHDHFHKGIKLRNIPSSFNHIHRAILPPERLCVGRETKGAIRRIQTRF
jgi:hypothetical protein